MSDHDEPSPPAGPPQPAAETDLSAEGVSRLRRLAGVILVGLVAYNLTALVLIFLAAGRGRPLDALLLALSAIIITPVLLGARRSVLERLARIGSAPGDSPPPPAGPS